MTHSFTSGEALTLDDLLRIAALFPKMPRVRIIVGMPGFSDDHVFKRQLPDESLFLIGRTAYETFRRSLPPPRTVIDPGELLAAKLCGVPIEYYGDRNDHPAILKEIALAMTRGLLLRVSLDEEFGNTDPRIS